MEMKILLTHPLCRIVELSSTKQLYFWNKNIVFFYSKHFKEIYARDGSASCHCFAIFLPIFPYACEILTYDKCLLRNSECFTNNYNKSK